MKSLNGVFIVGATVSIVTGTKFGQLDGTIHPSGKRFHTEPLEQPIDTLIPARIERSRCFVFGQFS